MAESHQIEVFTAKDTMETLQEISKILNTGLDSETLTICLRLCESGMNPEALSLIIKELQRETSAIQSAENCAQTT